jgi:hypothetical protein
MERFARTFQKRLVLGSELLPKNLMEMLPDGLGMVSYISRQMAFQLDRAL